MQYHYVSKVAPGMFYVTTYPAVLVRLAILESDTESETEACRILAAHHGGEWKVADSNMRQWQRTTCKVDGSVPAFPMPPKGWGVVSI